jgi:hypothetical protein
MLLDSLGPIFNMRSLLMCALLLLLLLLLLRSL